MRDVIVIGGGFAGVTAAREVALQGHSALLLEGRDRLGGRTWTADWNGQEIEYGGGWVHWHQPHAWSEMTRGGVGAVLSDPEAATSWWVDGERRTGTAEQRDAIAERGWNRFVAGAEEALPHPYEPLDGGAAMARFDGLTILQRIDELGLGAEERQVLLAECESLAHGFAHEAGARTLVHSLKYESLTSLAEPMARLMAGAVDPSTVDLIVPVPLHRGRERSRGYNQSALLAQYVARETGLSTARSATIYAYYFEVLNS